MVNGGFLMCPTATNLALRWKKFILTSKIMWQFTWLYPISTNSLFCNFLKEGLTFYLLGNGIFPKGVVIIFIHSILLSNRRRPLSPKLMSLLELASVLLLDEEYYAYNLFFSTAFTHQLSDRLCSISWATDNYAVYAGCDSFSSLSKCHDVKPSLHWTQSWHPTVDLLTKIQPMCATFWSEYVIALSVFGYSIIYPIIKYSFP